MPDKIVVLISGDGIGPEISRAAVECIAASMEKSYRGRHRLRWLEMPAGELSELALGDAMPKVTIDAIRRHGTALKGPLTTPVGEGTRSPSVKLRLALDLYAGIRPVKYYDGVPSPVKNPSALSVVIFRENTEDVYTGHEWAAGSRDARRLAAFLREKLDVSLARDSAIGLKPMSRLASARLARRALRFAVERKRRTVTFVHKGNIMKFTEGGFRDWGYEVARREFKGKVVFEEELMGAPAPRGKILVNDRIADNMFAQLLLRPGEYDVLVCPNLNGDYLSDAAAAQVGGLGLAPSGSIGDNCAVFEATHGTAPKYAGKNVANPTSMILSGAMMLEHLGFAEAAGRLERAVARTLRQKKFTQDLARLAGTRALRATEFTRAVIANL